MSPVVWDSLITDDVGRIDYARVRSLAAVVLAIAGGAVAIAAAVRELVLQQPLETNNLWPMVAALVLPITGGKIMDGINALVSRRASPPPEGAS